MLHLIIKGEGTQNELISLKLLAVFPVPLSFSKACVFSTWDYMKLWQGTICVFKWDLVLFPPMEFKRLVQPIFHCGLRHQIYQNLILCFSQIEIRESEIFYLIMLSTIHSANLVELNFQNLMRMPIRSRTWWFCTRDMCMVTDPETSYGRSSKDAGGRRRQMSFVKLKFSVYVCKGELEWRLAGHLFYAGRCWCSIPYSFLFSDKWPVLVSLITLA